MRKFKQFVAGLLTVTMILSNTNIYIGAQETKSAKETTKTESTTKTEKTASLPKNKVMAAKNEVQAQANYALANVNTYTLTLADINSSWSGNSINIQSQDELILLSHVEPSTYKNTQIELSLKNPVLDLTGVVQKNGNEYSFQGLGSNDNPFEGKFKPNASTTTITLNKALFYCISNKATQIISGGNGNINITWKGSDAPVLAEEFIFTDASTTSMWKFDLANYNANDLTWYSFGGLVGIITKKNEITLDQTTKLSLNVNMTNTANTFKATVSGTADNSVGLVCGTMDEGTRLDINDVILPDSEEVTGLGNASAGGLIGEMKAGAEVAFDKAIAIKDAIIKSSGMGNAGGLIGTAKDAIVTTSKSVSVKDAKISAASGSQGNAGGMIGSYTYSGNISGALNTIDKNWTVSTASLTPAAGKQAGGIIGWLSNVSNNGKFSIDGTGMDTPLVNDVTLNVTGGNNLAGIIGEYGTAHKESTLEIKGSNGVTLARSLLPSGNEPHTYGGVVGYVAQNTYVRFENIQVDASTIAVPVHNGGLIAYARDNTTIDVNNFTLLAGTMDSNSKNPVGNADGGGVIGNIGNGSALRLSGTTILNGTWSSQSGGYYLNSKNGQIVGVQENSLVYATKGWNLIRSTSNPTLDDIGSYGSVVRLDGTKLTEGSVVNPNADALLVVFETGTHNVKLNAKTGLYNGDITLNNERDFAMLAITNQSRGYFSGDTNINASSYITRDAGGNVTNADAVLMNKNITLNKDIDMSDTGVYCLTRDADDTGKEARFDTYKGTFDGQNHTLTLKAGEIYGTNADNKQGAIVNHQYVGLFAAIQGATVQNTTLKGSTTLRPRTEISAGGIAGISREGGSVTIDNVDLNGYKATNITNINDNISKQSHFGGLMGRANINSSYNLSISDCNINADLSYESELTKDGDKTIYAYWASMVGVVTANENNTITIDNNTVLGSIKTQNEYMRGGAVFGRVINGTAGTQVPIKINKLIVGNEAATNDATKAFQMNASSAGLLGQTWQNVEVSLQDVKINNSSLDINTRNFGGLFYEASGRITISKTACSTPAGNTGVKFTNSTFTNTKGSTGNTDALLVYTGKALFLNVDEDAYSIGENNDGTNITITKTKDYFDELVGYSIDKEESNGVVSYNLTNNTDGKIDTNGLCNTYKEKTTNSNGNPWKNSKTRYYYNLKTILETLPDFSITGDVNTPYELMSWSLLHYAQKDIRKYFGIQNTTTYTISGNLDMSNYSFYAVSSGDTNVGNAGTTNLIFDNKSIEDIEKTSNKTTAYSTTTQHYGMQTGLFRNVTGTSTTVQNLTISGNVGAWTTDGTADLGAGALVSGNLNTGSSGSVHTTTINNVVLKDLYVNGSGTTTSGYAPLFINRVYSYNTVSINNLKTDTDYSKYSMGTNTYAATSLIGRVGGQESNGINLIFSHIKLDARTAVGNAYPSGKTTKSIFARATLLESFQYLGESSGTYNFNLTEDWTGDTSSNNHVLGVTYGMEIDTSVRNVGEQDQYYDEELAVNATSYPTEIKGGTNFSTGYLPYVYMTKANSVVAATIADDDKYNEIDVNLRKSDLDIGCGTYGHPYSITISSQLNTLASFLINGTSRTSSGWVVTVNNTSSIINYGTNVTTVTSELCTSGDKDASYQADGNGGWLKGSYNGNVFVPEDNTSDLNDYQMLAYLQNAYYQIENDITVGTKFVGLGIEGNPFMGVIVGKKQDNGNYPTINFPEISLKGSSFGGLINVSYGSVVKNINLQYNEKITLNRTDTSATAKDMYYGGLIGFVLGGDNIIDNVSVEYQSANDAVTISGAGSNLIMAGGYVGKIGAGGVIFKNMGTKQGMVSSNVNFSGAASTGYDSHYYTNPFIGRVLNGYAACATANDKLENTDKNYAIPTLKSSSDGRLTVNLGTAGTGTKADRTIKVGSAQQLWVLSSVISSGAGAYGAATKETAGRTKYESNAYNKGKTRNASYDDIGNATNQNGDYIVAQKDEKYSMVKTDTLTDKVLTGYALTETDGKIPWLIYNYTNEVDTAASGLGKGAKYPARLVTGSYTRFSIYLNADADMKAYGNGFRGLNCRYITEANTSDTIVRDRGNLFLYNFYGGGSDSATTPHTITMNMNIYEYENEKYPAYGVGLFNALQQDNGNAYSANDTSQTKIVNNLNLSGTVSQQVKTSAGVTSSNYQDTQAVGGFAGKTEPNAGLNRTDLFSSEFDNVYLSHLNVNGSYHTGGLIGAVGISGTTSNGSTNKEACMPITIKNCGYINLNVEGVRYSGGLIGKFIRQVGNTSSTITISDFAASGESSVSQSQVNTDYGSGGLVGYCNIYNTQTISIANVNISGNPNDDIEIKGSSNAGGLVGYSESAVSVSDSTLASKGKLKVEVTSDDKKYAAGGIIGTTKGKFTAATCNINSDGNGKLYIKGLYIAGGIMGNYNKADTAEIKKCKIGSSASNNKYATVIHASSTANGSGNAGGILGYVQNNTQCKLLVDGCSVENIALQGGSRAGGLLSYLEDKATMYVKNTSITDNAITVEGISDQKSSGGLVGQINNTSYGLYGSNILWKDNLIGYYQKGSLTSLADDIGEWWDNNNGLTLTTGTVGPVWKSYPTRKVYTYEEGEYSTSDTSYSGVWVGNDSRSKDKSIIIQLSGVSRQITSANYAPMWDVSNGKDLYTGYIAYTDYTGTAITDSANKADTSPYVTTNPKSTVTVYDSESDAGSGTGGLSVTGDSSCYVSGGDKSIAQKVLEDYGTSAFTTGYYSGANDYKSEYESKKLLSTYNGVQHAGSTGGLTNDIPVLLITTNNMTETTNQIKAYLNLLTNGGYGKAAELGTGDEAKVSVNSVNCKYNGESSGDSKFVKSDKPSVVVSGSGSSLSYRVYPGRYDNTLDQFTLLTVVLGDDTTGKFTLYVPVIVKQVVQVSTSAVVHNDSPFYDSVYTEREVSKNHILLNYGDTFTAQLKYEYSAYDWNTAANTGSSLRWNYDKRVDFTTELPAGTRLTLVDANNSKNYSYTVAGNGESSIKLNDFVNSSDDTKTFSPLKLDTLLGFTAEQKNSGTLVEYDSSRENEPDATVKAKINGETILLRPATDSTEDKGLTHYSVSTDIKTEDSFQEKYYMVITMPDTSAGIINSEVKLCNERKDNLGTDSAHLPYDLSQVQAEGDRNENVYLVNSAFNQKITDNSDGTDRSTLSYEQVTKQQDKTFTLYNNITVQKQFAKYLVKGTDEVWQQFSFTFNNKDVFEKIPAGTEYSVKFTLCHNGTQISGTNLRTVEGSINTTLSSLEVMYPDSLTEVISNLNSYGDTDDTIDFQIKAEITFNFKTDNAMSIFPAYSEGLTSEADFKKGYIRVNTDSRINFTQTSLLSGAKTAKLGNIGYYQIKPAEALLTYDADDVSQLGINCRNLASTGNISVINTTAIYDLSAITNLDEVLKEISYIECTLTLQQKSENEFNNSDDSYVDLVEPSQYMKKIFIGEGSSAQNIAETDKKWTWKLDKEKDDFDKKFYNSETKCFNLPFELRVNNKIEDENGLYANYKVTLTVTAKRNDGTEVLNKLDDFVIYTIAKVPTTIVK